MYKAAFWLVIFFLTFQVGAIDRVTIVTEDYPPYSYLNPQGQVVGLATENVIEIMRLANLDFKIQLLPWARAYDHSIKFANTIIYPIVALSSRKAEFHFICPIAVLKNFNFYRLATRVDIQVKSLNDAKLYITGVVRNDSIHTFLLGSGFEENKHLDIAANDDVTLRKLLHGRIDLIYTSQETLNSRLTAHKRPFTAVKAEYQIPAYSEQNLCLGISRKSSPLLHEKLKQAQQSFMTSNPQLTNKY